MKTIKFLLIFIFMTAFSLISKADELRYWAYCDKDGDGHACPQKLKEISADKVFYYLDQGWLVANHKPALDCDDDNPLLFNKQKVWVDADGDKYVNGYKSLCIGTSIPTGYILEADILGYRDCNDADPSVWKTMTLFFDGDGDKHVAGLKNSYCVGLPATYPANYIDRASVIAFNDCDDTNPLVWRTYCKKGTPPGKNYSVCGGDEPSDCGDGLVGADLTYSVYPNPVNDRLNITPNENWNNRVEIRLVDQFGRVARVVNNPSVVKGQAITINTGDLKPGIYNLTIKNGELMATKKIGVKL